MTATTIPRKPVPSPAASQRSLAGSAPHSPFESVLPTRAEHQSLPQTHSPRAGDITHLAPRRVPEYTDVVRAAEKLGFAPASKAAVCAYAIRPLPHTPALSTAGSVRELIDQRSPYAHSTRSVSSETLPWPVLSTPFAPLAPSEPAAPTPSAQPPVGAACPAPQVGTDESKPLPPPPGTHLQRRQRVRHSSRRSWLALRDKTLPSLPVSARSIREIPPSRSAELPLLSNTAVAVHATGDKSTRKTVGWWKKLKGLLHRRS